MEYKAIALTFLFVFGEAACEGPHNIRTGHRYLSSKRPWLYALTGAYFLRLDYYVVMSVDVDLTLLLLRML